MDPHLIPGENAAMQAIEQAERIGEQAQDEFDRGDLSGEFVEAVLAAADELAEEATNVAEWNKLRGRVAHAAPKLYARISKAVIADRIETLYEEARR